MSAYFYEHIGPEYEYAQSEIAGLCLRIGNHAWVFGRYDYREKTCPWPVWARVRLTIAHRGEWKLFAFGRRVFSFGGAT